MELFLQRREPSERGTLGDLFGNGVWCSFTLEDPKRSKKIAGDTCIPAGTYKIVMSYSNRFQRILPLLLDVPGFEGIRIHGGNTKEDTHGCILVAAKCDTFTKRLLQSRYQLDLLLDAWEKDPPTVITIKDYETPPDGKVNA